MVHREPKHFKICSEYQLVILNNTTTYYTILAVHYVLLVHIGITYRNNSLNVREQS